MFRLAAAPYRCLVSLAFILASGPAFCQTVAPAAAPSAASSTEPALRVFDPSLIDKTVDPCDNFYRFSCNGWFKRNPLPADQAAYGRFTELAEINRAHLRQILEASAQPSPMRTANEQKIGDEFASCMDVAAINARGLKSLQPELDRIAALKSKEPIISPTWSPDGSRLAYVSFENKKPVVYVHSLSSGQRIVVANFKGSNSARVMARLRMKSIVSRA